MADQTLGGDNISNVVVVEPGKLPLLSVVCEDTTLYPGAVAMKGTAWPQVMACEETNEPAGVMDCPATHNIDTAFAANQVVEMAPKGGNAIVYVEQLAASPAVNWEFGDIIMASQTADKDGQVDKLTAALLADPTLVLYKIGHAEQTLTGTTTDTRWGRIRLSN